jgi:aminopeptidase N
VNPDQVGYFRVTYDDANWMLLAKALRSGNFEAFSPSTRAMLIGDAGTFTQMNLMNVKLFFELFAYLEHEIDYAPWKIAAENLHFLNARLEDESSEIYADFKVN